MSTTADKTGPEERRNSGNNKNDEVHKRDKKLPRPPDAHIKVILLGNSGVGKTSLKKRFIDEGVDIRSTVTSLCCDFHRCTRQLMGIDVELRIWDAGDMDQRFRSANLVANFYRRCEVVLLVFALDDHESFLALPRWLERVHDNVGRDSQFDCCVIGNKSDRAERRLVSRQEAEQFANKHGFFYIETSALEMASVEKAFIDVSLAVIRRHKLMQQSKKRPDQKQPSSSIFFPSRESGSCGKKCGGN